MNVTCSATLVLQGSCQPIPLFMLMLKLDRLVTELGYSGFDYFPST